jgi:Electron transfer DM13
MKRTWVKVAIALLVVAAIALFYWFRPDRLFSNVRVNEGIPAVQSAAAALAIESGTFYTILHPTSGTATIYRMGDGSHVLRFTNFDTSNGPDVHVYMVASDDAKDAATVENAGFVDLGSIKGNVGDQNYTLPSDLDLAKYRAVSIWCKRFSVNFGAAALKPAETSQVR